MFSYVRRYSLGRERSKHISILADIAYCICTHVTVSLKTLLTLGRAVASWFVTLIRMHMHAGSSPDWGTVRTGPLASLLTPSSFVLARQCLKMCVLCVDVET